MPEKSVRNQPALGVVFRAALRPITYLATASLLLLAAATSVAWHEYEQVVALRADAVGADTRRALEARLAALKRRNLELETRVAALTHAGAADATAASAEGAAEKAGAAATLLANANAAEAERESKKDAELDLLAAMSDMPEFQKLIALGQRGAIADKYAGLFRKLHLSPDQQDQLERLLADKQSAFADAMIAAHDQGLTGKDARQMALAVARATDKQIDDSMKSLLGDNGYKQYQNYERTAPERAAVAQLADRLSYTKTPLNQRQQDQLVQAIATGQHQESVALAATNGGKPVRIPRTVPPLPGAANALGVGTSNTATITPAAVVTASNFLTPVQVQALQQMQQEQQAQLALSNLLKGRPAPALPVAVAPAPAPKPGKG